MPPVYPRIFSKKKIATPFVDWNDGIHLSWKHGHMEQANRFGRFRDGLDMSLISTSRPAWIERAGVLPFGEPPPEFTTLPNATTIRESLHAWRKTDEPVEDAAVGVQFRRQPKTRPFLLRATAAGALLVPAWAWSPSPQGWRKIVVILIVLFWLVFLQTAVHSVIRWTSGRMWVIFGRRQVWIFQKAGWWRGRTAVERSQVESVDLQWDRGGVCRMGICLSGQKEIALFRHEYDDKNSVWLGRLIAGWAGAPFRSVGLNLN